LFDYRYKELKAIDREVPSTTAPCAEWHRVFALRDRIAHGGLYVCAQCKHILEHCVLPKR
jgi:hypothetical protein